MIIDDLLGVIVTFTTTHATLDALVHFAPLRLYNNNLWKRKATVESRGLMMNDSVVDGNWYEYYLIRNRTYWGKLLFLKLGGPDIPCKQTPYEVIFSYHSNQRNYSIIQHDNLDIHVQSDKQFNGVPQVHNINRKIRQVLDTHQLVLLDEYGELWILYHKFMKVDIGFYVVSIGNWDIPMVNSVVIDRAGNAFDLCNVDHKNDYNFTVTRVNPLLDRYRIVESTGYGMFIVSTGITLILDSILGKVKPLDEYDEHDRLVRLLTEDITSTLSEVYAHHRSIGFRVVGVTDSAILTSTRTIYDIHVIKTVTGHPKIFQPGDGSRIIKYTLPHAITITINRTQNIYQDGETVYAILDPYTQY